MSARVAIEEDPSPGARRQCRYGPPAGSDDPLRPVRALRLSLSADAVVPTLEQDARRVACEALALRLEEGMGETSHE